jgi:ribosomal protein S18 acetylase RimI-like enzyme
MTQPWQIRPATVEEVSGVVAVQNAHSLDVLGTPRTAEHWQLRRWYEDGVNLAQDTRVAVTDTGEIVGYAQVVGEAPFVVIPVSGAVHPAYRGQGIGSCLLAWATARATEIAAKAPAPARVVMHSNLFATDNTGITLLQEHGWGEVRQFVHLRLEMDKPPIEPTWPEGIEVRPLQPPDWAKVGPAMDEAFADHWGTLTVDIDEEDDEAEPEGVIEKPVYDRDYWNTPGLCFVAWAGDEVAGVCLCNGKSLEWPEAGYLGSLSVRRPWRRTGLGLALSLHALGEFYRRGTRVVITDTDGDGFTKAYALYQKLGMTIYRQENVYEKEIRPGRDWLRRGWGNS